LRHPGIYDGLGTLGRIRTYNPLVNSEVRYHCATSVCMTVTVELSAGFEPATSRLRDGRSVHLSSKSMRAEFRCRWRESNPHGLVVHRLLRTARFPDYATST
jgi:hypothetical protein